MGRGAAKAGLRPIGLCCALSAAAAGSAPVAAGPLASPGCLDGGAPAVVQDMAPGLELRLTDGRLVRLAGLAVGEEGEVATSVEVRLRTWLAGRIVRVVPLGGAPDRWNRTQGVVFAADGTDGRDISVGEALLDAGLARARPDAAVQPCWDAYLRLEAGAREAHRGLWAEGGTFAAGDAAALRARLGQFVVVEGTVESLYAGRARTYLRFADAPSGGFAATLERRAGQRFARAGIDPESWRHRRVRIRGVLDDRWGLQIEVTMPEQVEVLGP